VTCRRAAADHTAAASAAREASGRDWGEAGTGDDACEKGRGWSWGMPVVSAPRDDQYVRVKLVIPPTLTENERSLFEKLADASHFNPRALMKG
jgi:hypothetical protein